MIKIEKKKLALIGPKGKIPIRFDDEISFKFSMLYEGECEGLGATYAAEKFEYSRQRYYQLLWKLKNEGAEALRSKKTGPHNNYRKTDETIRQVIRHRFLDPKVSPKVIVQKLNQTGYIVSIRSVERIIYEYGLQKKTLHLSSRKKTKRN